MTKRNRSTVADNRAEKKQATGRVIKEKFIDERNNPPPILAKTQKQKEYLKALVDPNIRVVIVLGFHGTGKTWCSSAVAADAFRKGEVDQIIVTRPYVQTGRTSGFKPGTSLEKMYPYVRNCLDTIKSRIGHGAYENALKDGLTGQIVVQEIESIRGRSFDNDCFVLCDEMQQSLPEEMQSVVTRISDRAKLILMGDVRQKDIRGESGLEWFLSFVKRHNIPGVAIIDFDEVDDIVRGGFVRDIAIGLMKDNGGKV